MAGALVTTNILGTTVAMGLATLREQVVLVMAANREYERLITGATRNATVNVAVPTAVATRTVAPDVVPPAVTAVTPTSVPVTLSQWKEAPFVMDDKGLSQVDRNIIPMQAKEAIKSVANTIEDYLWSLLTPAIYQYYGTAGTTPFGTGLDDFTQVDKLLNDSLADADNRVMIINTSAKANAMSLRALQDASFRNGDTSGIVKGKIGEILGAMWAMSQRVPNHTAGTYPTGATNYTASGVNALGATTVNIAGGAQGTLIAADIISFGATIPGTYNVVSSTGGGTVTAVVITPGLLAATAGGEVVTKRQTFAQNLLMHRDCLAFAMAPLIDTVQLPGASMQAVAIDEVSGLSLRLEVTRQHKQVQWAYDALYGGAVVRAGLGAWLAG